MSRKIVLATLLAVFAAACAPKPEPAPVEVTTEPVYTGKYN